MPQFPHLKDVPNVTGPSEHPLGAAISIFLPTTQIAPPGTCRTDGKQMSETQRLPETREHFLLGVYLIFHGFGCKVINLETKRRLTAFTNIPPVF